MDIVREWFRRHFSNPQLVVLLLILLACFATMFLFGRMLIPLLISLVIAYLLDSVVLFLGRHRVPRLPAVVIVYSGFLAAFVGAVLILVPLLTDQVRDLAKSVGTVNVDELVDGIPEEFWEVFGETEAPEEDSKDDAENGESGAPTPESADESLPAKDGPPESPDAESTDETAEPNAAAANGGSLPDHDPSADADPTTPAKRSDSEPKTANESAAEPANDPEPAQDEGAAEKPTEIEKEGTPVANPKEEFKARLRGIPGKIQEWIINEFDAIGGNILGSIPVLIQLLVY